LARRSVFSVQQVIRPRTPRVTISYVNRIICSLLLPPHSVGSRLAVPYRCVNVSQWDFVMHQHTPFIVAVPTAEAVLTAPNCHVQITKTDDGGYSFSADMFCAGAKVSSVYCEGMEVFYEGLDRRWELGWRVVGIESCPEDIERLAPLYNAIADLKVLSDAGVAILAGHLRVIGRTNMIVADPGQRATLVPTEERESIAPCAIEVAVWEANTKNNEAYIIDTEKEASMAATLVSESRFKPSYMDCFRTLQHGEAITGLYSRMVLAAERVAKLHADFSYLAQYPTEAAPSSSSHVR
jgi:hypothetical protein